MEELCFFSFCLFLVCILSLSLMNVKGVQGCDSSFDFDFDFSPHLGILVLVRYLLNVITFLHDIWLA